MVAPKKARLKEAEGELAVAMKVRCLLHGGRVWRIVRGAYGRVYPKLYTLYPKL